ncbi:MAG: glycosyltransferase family 2 protein [Acidobacteriaceae bacterium]|nr:glycosyltransferase family 2 protein [Acidobacteriaceae bacterium]
MASIPEVEILLPVHNEAESIEGTIRETYGELSPRVNAGFIVCEDGSRDNTREILQGLAQDLPLRLNMSPARKGYSKAVREGMQMLQADYLLCLDSDGQCDPKDFWKFWALRSDYDLIIGWRVHRSDTLLRRTFSRFFYHI